MNSNKPSLSKSEDFNATLSTWMHIDLNSCFATVEQQANPLLRGKPIAVAAYATDRSCILAPSIEAKKYGVKTGMRVSDGKQLCPGLIVLTSDPNKYRFVNQAFSKLLSEYSPHMSIRSIDEILLSFSGLPILKTKTMQEIGKEIKMRIKQEIGEWLTVSIGISTNPYLAKLAAGLHKPDGLDEINQYTILPVLHSLTLMDLPYIKERNILRLLRVKVKTPVDFYKTSAATLKIAFPGITAYYWYLRLHGYSVDEVEWQRRTIGHSFHLIKFTADYKELSKLLCKLVEKMGRRIRKNECTAQGISVACYFADGTLWHQNHTFPNKLYTNKELFASACYLLQQAMPLKPVRILAVSSFHLEKNLYSQLTLFSDAQKTQRLTRSLDTINERWGEFSITPALMIGMKDTIVDRISFGKVHDMTQLVV